MANKSLSRNDRKRQIIHTLALWWARDQHWRTSTQLARALGLEPSTHFNAILQELVVEESIVEMVQDAVPGKFLTRYFMLNPDNVTDFQRRREVTVKKGGKPVGQLELL